VACAFLFSERTPWLRLDDRANTWLLRLLADARTPWLTDVATGIKAAGSGWVATVLGLSVVVLTMIFRRWRHLLVFLGSVFLLEIVAGEWIYRGLSRPRPYGVVIIGRSGGRGARVPAGYLLATRGARLALVAPAPAQGLRITAGRVVPRIGSAAQPPWAGEVKPRSVWAELSVRKAALTLAPEQKDAGRHGMDGTG
jgi:hypothetical protein